MSRTILKRLSFAGALCVACALAATSQAQFGRGHKHAEGPDIERLADKLGLEAGTKAGAQHVLQETRAKAKRLRAKRWELKKQLRGLLDQERPDEAAVMQTATELGRIESQLHKLRLSTMLRIRGLLSPEQRLRLKELRGTHAREIREQCEPDVKALCEDAADPKAAMTCLVEKRQEVSPECKDAMLALLAQRSHHGRWHHGRRGRGHHRGKRY